MSRIKRDSRIETRSARARLPAQHDPYWRQIHPGLSLGYRKGRRGGTWIARHMSAGKYRKLTLGTADDYADADGENVLDYKQASRRAHEFAETPIEQRPRSKYTVSDALDDYLKWHKAHGKSYDRTRHIAKAHIYPALGRVNLATLTARQIGDWQDELIEAPLRRRSKRQTIDPGDPEALRRRKSTANRIMTVLKAALNHAYAAGMVDRADAWARVRPFRGVDVPKERYLSQDECRRLINASEPDFRDLVRAALLTGCRWGELIRLECRDYNPDSGTISIRITKSGKGRHVPLTDEGQAFFERACMNRDGLIFTRADGEPWGRAHQTRRMRAACEAARITPPASFHDLRNTYGSMLAMKGVPLHVIAEVLGHADTRMTQRHYAHLQPSYVADTIRSNLPSFGGGDAGVVTQLKTHQ